MQTNRVNSQTNFKGKTFLMIKPDAVKKGAEAKILEKVLNVKGLSITKIKKDTLSKEIAETHYSEHKGKPFFNGLIDFITEGPVVKVEVKGRNAVKKVRALSDNIRADFGTDKTRNAVHTSDSKKASKKERALHFPATPSKISNLLNKLNPFKK